MKEIVVALSGTLETFSLPDVLRLLSSTNKTGLLALDGDRGRGRIWVRDGAIVAADADRAVNDQIDGVAFELLRFADAGFEFHSGDDPDVGGEAHDVEEVLAEAGARLEEWREIEAVVPSLDVWVRMVPELDADRTVTVAQWRVLAQIGTGASGHDLAQRLGAGEYDICRQLRDLMEAGVVDLDEAPTRAVVEPAAPAPAVDIGATWEAAVEEPTFVEPALDPDAVSSLGADLASFVAVGTVEEPVEVDADDEELMAELSQLSPKAAAAVEATWTVGAAGADDDADEAIAGDVPAPNLAASGGEGEIDQNLLLRFLSSTTEQ